MATFVSLVHTVFNLGLNVKWEVDKSELKSFKSIEEWSKIILQPWVYRFGQKDITRKRSFRQYSCRIRKNIKMKRLRILTLCSVSIALAIFLFKKKRLPQYRKEMDWFLKKEWLTKNKNPVTPKEYCRPADQTFLTFPESFPSLYSPDEQAQYFKHTTATTFPYTTHTTQIWQSYKIVCDQIRDNFVYNGGYHFMIWVEARAQL